MCNKSVDLLIPRGSNAFVQYIMNNTKIPVMGHADGICHTYIDKDADIEKAIPIIIDAKTQYTAACNATETLLIHRDVAKEMLPVMAKALKKHGVKLRGCRISSVTRGRAPSWMAMRSASWRVSRRPASTYSLQFRFHHFSYLWYPEHED